ncbi:hypothetical protein MKW98_026600, partial [Papaver atlanticum]
MRTLSTYTYIIAAATEGCEPRALYGDCGFSVVLPYGPGRELHHRDYTDSCSELPCGPCLLHCSRWRWHVWCFGGDDFAEVYSAVARTAFKDDSIQSLHHFCHSKALNLMQLLRRDTISVVASCPLSLLFC